MFKKFHQRRNEMLAGDRAAESFNQTLQSYLGLLQHANSHQLRKKLKKLAGIKTLEEIEALYPLPTIPDEIASALGLFEAPSNPQ